MISNNIERLYVKAGLVALLCAVSSFALPSAVENPWTTRLYLQKYGADCETHKVITDDKYILELHRITCGQTNSQGVAFLQHGLFQSSTDWVLLGNNSLGLYLCQKGYDVWLGNSRGNRYSNKHVTLSTSNPKYWKFSWHEMGIYDLPAVIEYILSVTEESKLHYVAYSQGPTEFMVYASRFPKKAKKTIYGAHLLAPVGCLSHATNPFIKLLSPLLGSADPLSCLKGDVEFLPNTVLPALAGKVICNESNPKLCENVYFLLTGSSKNVDEEIISEMLNTLPAGCSLHQIKHYLQLFRTKSLFRQFDCGSAINLKLYGSIKPKKYDLEKISINTYAYYGSLDNMADPTDVNCTLSQFNPSVLKRVTEYGSYSHLDFMYSRNVLEEVNYLVEEDMIRSKED